VRAPHGRTAMIFVTILGLFLVPFRDKIAANSDQMHFLTKKCSKMRFRPELRLGPSWGSLQRSSSAANLFTVDSRRVVPARYRRDCEDALYKCTDLLTYISSTIGCANFGPDWPLLFKVHEI